MLLFILCSIFIADSSFADSTTPTVPKCTFPNVRLTIQNVTGTIPFGAAGLVNIPYGTRCTFKFDVPPGHALRIATTARGNYEQISFNNQTINLPVQNHEEYSVDKEVSYLFYSWSTNYTLLARWSYVDLSQFAQKVVHTGNYFNLQLPPLTYYTVRAAENDQVAYAFSDLYSYAPLPYDYALQQVFVYDGADILSSTYLGRADRVYFGTNATLSSTSRFHSTGRTLSFLNLYAQPSRTFLMANDWKKLDANADYFVLTISEQYGGDGIMQDPFTDSNTDAYYTVICPDCNGNHMFITKLDFYQFPSNTSRFVEIQGLTPTHQMPYLIRYDYSNDTTPNFPQLINTNVATFHTHRTNLAYTLKTTYGDWPGYTEWRSVSDGAQRHIISPHLWNPANAIQGMDSTVYTNGDDMAYTLVVDDFEKNAGGNSTYLEVTGYSKQSSNVWMISSTQRFNNTIKSQTVNVTCSRLQIQLFDPTNTSTIIAHVGVKKIEKIEKKNSSSFFGFNFMCILMMIIGSTL